MVRGIGSFGTLGGAAADPPGASLEGGQGGQLNFGHSIEKP